MAKIKGGGIQWKIQRDRCSWPLSQILTLSLSEVEPWQGLKKTGSD